MHRSILSRPLVAAAVAMLATAAVPAMASTRPTGNPEGSAAAATEVSGQQSKKICLSPTVSGDPVVTGSILAKKACHTKAEWEAKGVIFKTK